MIRRALVLEGQTLLEKRRRRFNVTGLSHTHDFLARRRRVFHMFEHMRRIDEVEAGRHKGKDCCLGNDQFGAIGVPGDVNNHYGRILFGATMTALLSVGARLPAGNTEGFFPTMGQQLSANAAQSVAQSGAEILRRTLPTNPTITLEAGTPVTIRPGENISLLSGPKVVR